MGQQVKDLVAQGAPPPNLSPEEVIAQSPVVYFEDSREGESTIKYDLTVHLPFFDTRTKRRQFQDVPHQLHGGIALWQRHTLLTCARHRPLFSRHTLPIAYQTGGYLQASKQLTSRVSVTLGGRVDHYDILSKTRFSPRAGVKVGLTDTLSWNSSTGTYYQQPAFLFVSAFPQNRSLGTLAVSSLRDGPGLVGSKHRSPSQSAEIYRKI